MTCSGLGKLLGVVSLSLQFTSCIMNTEINVRTNGSAGVTTSYVFLDTTTTMKQIVAYQETFFSSHEISGLSWDKDSQNVAFDIRTIDSLGNYMSNRFTKDYFQFRYHGDTLTFTESKNPALKKKHSMDCCLYLITITSERKIKSVLANNSSVTQDGNSVIIKKKPRHLRKGKKQTEVVIVFEHTP